MSVPCMCPCTGYGSVPPHSCVCVCSMNVYSMCQMVRGSAAAPRAGGALGGQRSKVMGDEVSLAGHFGGFEHGRFHVTVGGGVHGVRVGTSAGLGRVVAATALVSVRAGTVALVGVGSGAVAFEGGDTGAGGGAGADEPGHAGGGH